MLKSQTDLNKTVKELQLQVNLLQAYLDYSPDIIVAGDVNGRIIEFNHGAEEFLGYQKEEVLGKPIAGLYHNPWDRKKMMHLVHKQGKVIDYECRLKTKSKQIIDISTTVAYLYNQKKEIIGTIGIAKDISRRKQLENILKKTAITDGLTGLYDRGYFNTRIKNAVEKSKEYHKQLSLIMIDLDGFKKYNDQKGHLAGDKVLHKIGQIILKNTDLKFDSAYRYGGDEFAILIGHRRNALAEKIAEIICRKISEHFAPDITASIGVARLKAEHDVADFIHLADKQMYQAKRQGRNRVCLSSSAF
ncbi:MAG: sensor domain-containing diguanylate cyclase [Planctomycetota bacterium]